MNQDIFRIEGKHALRGDIHVKGSKNAVLPIMAASILTSAPVTLTNVPRISDVETMKEILTFLGSKISHEGDTLSIDNADLAYKPIPHELVRGMRASIVLLGPLLARFGEAKMAYPGGCVLGKRPVDTHLTVLAKLGAEIIEQQDELHLKSYKLSGTTITMPETSVTGTENLIAAAALASGQTTIKLAATEPHVQDLCNFLCSMGATIEGVGSTTITITGSESLGTTTHRIIPDYIETGTFIVAGAIVDGSSIVIKDGCPEHLDKFFLYADQMGLDYKILDNKDIVVNFTPNLKPLKKLETRLYPGFPTDLQAPFSLLLAHANGVSKIHETLFEGRLNYLFELEKMGVQTEILNPHQAIVIGPTDFRGRDVTSCDLRAGATLVVAALAARGITNVFQISYLNRGYETLEKRLNGIGARIEKITSDTPVRT